MSQRTLPRVLLSLVESDPDACLLRTVEEDITRADVLSRSCRVAAELMSLGLGAGEPVAIMAPNRAEVVFSWFGILLAGGVEVPVNPAEVGQRLVHVLDHSRARFAIVDTASLEHLVAVQTELRHLEHVLVLDPLDGDQKGPTGVELSSYPTGERSEVVPDRAFDLAVGDPAAVLYTSGSTGPSKGVVVSHGHHFTNGRQPVDLFDISPTDTVYVCLPLHHNMAQGYGVWPALVSGAAIALEPSFSAVNFLASVRRTGATVLPFVGAMLALVAKLPEEPDDRSNPLRVGYGIPIPALLHEAMEARYDLQLAHCYGSTEATIVAWGTGPDRVLGAAGKVLPTYDVRVLDALDQPVPTGTVGEICVRPIEPFSMFSGYYHDNERTVRAWRNLWFHSGDRGRFDDAGNLWFVDRLGDGIRRMGEFVSSFEVEQALLGHPAVRMVAAVAVPSDLIEEEILVLVVADPDTSVDAAGVREWCAARLPRHAVPRYVELVAELPMTPTGKVEKFKLRDRGVTSATDDARAVRTASAQSDARVDATPHDY